MSPVAQSIIERLDAARQKWWLFTLLTSAVLTLCISGGTLLVFMLTDALLRLPQATLAVLGGIWLVTTVTLLGLLFRRLVRSQRSLEATARCVEYEFPELGSDLINVLQLSEDTQNESRAFCEAAVNAAAMRVGHLDFDAAAAKESRWRRFLFCMQTPRDLGESFAVLGGLILIAVVSHMLIPNWGSAANRLIQPWEYVPSVGTVRIVSVKPGSTEVLVGRQPGDHRRGPQPGQENAQGHVVRDGGPRTRGGHADGGREGPVLQADSAVGAQAARLPAGDRRFAERAFSGRHSRKAHALRGQGDLPFPGVSRARAGDVLAETGRP